MNHSIENHAISLVVNERGAEISGMVQKKTDRELLWQADPSHWPRHAPVLFPIVGRLKHGNSLLGNKKEIHLSQHGFARDVFFELQEKRGDFVRLKCVGGKETQKLFPFDFEFYISYQLLDNGVKTSYEVFAPISDLNKDGLWFSIGAHPGFNWPFHAHENSEDYAIEFEKPERLETHLLIDGLRSGETKLITEESSILLLSHTLFENDALIFKNLKSDWVKIVNQTTREYIQVTISGWPWLGIWTKQGAPFICIEPWQGVTDSIDSLGNFEEKEGIVKLMPGESWHGEFEIESSN